MPRVINLFDDKPIYTNKPIDGKESLGDEILSSLIQVINDEANKESSYISSSLSPSMLGCIRKGFYKRNKTPKNIKYDNKAYTLSGMAEIGTDRHVRLQNYIKKVDFLEYVDIKDYIEDKKLSSIKIMNKFGNEYLCWDKNLKMSFMVDGLLYDKRDGDYYLFEIKTEGYDSFKDRVGVSINHSNQCLAYCLVLGLNKAIFLYEDRVYLNKKCYAISISEGDIEGIKTLINKIDDYHSRNVLPPATYDSKEYCCKYCDYVSLCKKDLVR